MSRNGRGPATWGLPWHGVSCCNAKAALALLATCMMLAVFSSAGLAGTAATAAYNRANQLYEQGKYKEAISEYRQILDSGIENGYVYYNLGNACFQTKQLGQAILAYERASRLIPRDEDVRSNLEYIRLLTVDKIEAPQPGWISHLFSGLLGLLSLSEVAVLAWMLYVLFISMAIILVLTRGRRVREFLMQAGAVALVLLILAGTLLSLKIRAAESTRQAIVMAPKVEARSGPGEEYTKMFTLHEGAKVKIRQSREGWHLVSIPGGTGGWVEANAVERI